MAAIVWLVGSRRLAGAGHRRSSSSRTSSRRRTVLRSPPAIPFVVGERDAAAANALVAFGAADRHVSGSLARFRGPVALRTAMGVRRQRDDVRALGAAARRRPALARRVTRRAPARRTGSSWRRDLHEGVDAVVTPDRPRRHDVADLRVQRRARIRARVARARRRATASGWVRRASACSTPRSASAPSSRSRSSGAPSRRSRPTVGVVVSLVLTSVPLALLSVMTRPGAACAVLVAVGVGVVIFEVLAVSLVQRLSRLQVLGRVYGIENMMVNGGKLTGSLLGPLLVAVFSLRASLLVAAIVVVVVSPRWPYRASSRVSRVAEARRRRARTDRRPARARSSCSTAHHRLALERLAGTLQVMHVAARRRRDRRGRCAGLSLRHPVRAPRA